MACYLFVINLQNAVHNKIHNYKGFVTLLFSNEETNIQIVKRNSKPVGIRWSSVDHFDFLLFKWK